MPQLDRQGESATRRPSAPSGRKKYPLLVMTNHPRWGVHSQHDDITWLREIETCKISGPDGYQYHPLWMHPADAERPRHQARRRRVHLQRAGHGARRRLRDRADHARRGRHRPRRQVRPHRPGRDRPGRRHQHHRARATPPRRTRSATRSAASWPRSRRPTWKRSRRKYPEAFARPFHPCAGPGLRSLHHGGRCLMGKVMRHRSSHLQRLPQLPGRLQGRARGQRLVAHRQAPARHRPVLEQGHTTTCGARCPRSRSPTTHSICQHCEDAPCIDGLQRRSAIYKRDDGIVIIDPEKCRGNQLCLEACPYENVIYFNDDLNIAQKCTFCAHLLDEGWTETRCVGRLPHRRLHLRRRGRPGDQGARSPRPSSSSPSSPRQAPGLLHRTCPRSGSPAPSIDPEADECTEGATVTATNDRDRREGDQATTDNYGDFWLRDLEDGQLHPAHREARLPAPEARPRRRQQKDLNVGDIALWKA